jgi:Zn-dependent protease
VNPTFPLGRIAGIRIGVNWSWLVIFGLIAWSLESTVFPDQDPHLSRTTYILMGLAAAFLFIASLLLHELGHALVARREGIEIDGITLWLFGGVTRFKGTFRSPGSEFRIAIAGPLVSLALGGLSVGVALLVRTPVSVQGVAAWLGYSNLLLFVFNMLPAAPLDGGRVLHALVWRTKHDYRRATRVATGSGRALGYLLIAGGVALLFTRDTSGGIWLAFVGWFLVQAATAESRQPPPLRPA